MVTRPEINGADFLCYVTLAEHLTLPTVEHVRKGVIATKLVAYAVNSRGSRPTSGRTTS